MVPYIERGMNHMATPTETQEALGHAPNTIISGGRLDEHLRRALFIFSYCERKMHSMMIKLLNWTPHPVQPRG